MNYIGSITNYFSPIPLLSRAKNFASNWGKTAAVTSVFFGIGIPLALSPTFLDQESEDNTLNFIPTKPHNTQRSPSTSDDPRLFSGPHVYDNRPYVRIIIDRYIATWRDIQARLHSGYEKIKDRLGITSARYTDLSKPLETWKDTSTCLYLFVHGLNGHPSDWNEYEDEIKTQHPDADVRLLYVPKKGNCSAKEATTPMIAVLENYCAQFPNNPIALIGTSRGGPIISTLELHLRKQQNPVYVGTIAGANYGSLLVSLLNKLRLAFLLLDPELSKELSYGSEKAKEILENQREPLPSKVERKFRYYSTTEETEVLPTTSELPQINQSEEHFYVHGEGHVSIVKRVRDHLLKDVTTWLGLRFVNKEL